MTAETMGKPDQSDFDSEPIFDSDGAEPTRFDLVREGMRRDGVEILEYEPRFPVPGTKEEKRVVRLIAGLLLLTGLASTVFIAVFIFWPWEYEYGGIDNASKWYTPLLGISLGVSLLSLGAAVVIWSKKMLPHEIAVQDRHDGPSSDEERRLTAATLAQTGEDTGVARRPLLKGALLAGLAPLGLATVVPLGALLKDPHADGDPLLHTGFDPKLNDSQPVRLVHQEGTPIRPEDVSVGGQLTVFPGIPGGASNKYADSSTLLIHLRESDAEKARQSAIPMNEGAQWGNFVAYSKICTHVGCPASLYEQQSNKLLCPCHQSQFLITDNARPIFGPATRRLPQLPITVDEEGFFVAKSDYPEAIGPAFWERP
ncbi:MAG: cytochrome bc1 complex Rieske iron-sulfur subunit [Dehalococcoidia bacterium]